jgi:hypothetical protein
MKRLLAGLLCALVLHITVSAHVLDQYLQVAQIALSPEGARVELRLIPGVQVAPRIFALIDTDGDEKISPDEEQAYAQRVLQDIGLEVDGQRAPLTLAGIQFPLRHEMNEGNGAIRLNLAAEVTLGAAGEHQLAFRNDHLPELGVYLANALVPASDAIKTTEQHRDPLQHGLQVDFRVRSANTSTQPWWTGVWLISLMLLLFGLFLTMFIPRRKRLRSFYQPNPRKCQARVETDSAWRSS